MNKLTGQETLKPIGIDVEHLKQENKVVYKNVLFEIEQEPLIFQEQGKTKVGSVKLKDAEFGNALPTIEASPLELYRIVNNL